MQSIVTNYTLKDSYYRIRCKVGVSYGSDLRVVRQALEYYLEDLEDLKLGIERLRDPADPILEWDDVRRELLDQD